MADVERLAAGQEATPRGRVRVALPDGLASHWLIPALPHFFARYPDVEIDCTIGHAVVDLTRREADIAVRFVPPTAPELVSRPLTRITLEPFVHPRLAASPLHALRWIQLADPDARFDETQWIMRHAPGAQTMNVSLWHAVFAGVKAGLGAGLFMVYHRAMRDVPRVAAFRQWLVSDAAPLLGM